MAASTVFSDYEVRKIGFKFMGDDAFESVECIGSAEEEMESRTVVKKCRGVERKKRTRGTGKGTVKLSLHMPWELYAKAYGMNLDTLVDGVKAYGTNSRHGVFSMVEEVYDEDDNLKLKAYPNCVIESGKTTKSENGAEEIAEIELEISIMPDDYGNGVYEAIVSELEDDSIKEQWLTAFTPDLVNVPSA